MVATYENTSQEFNEEEVQLVAILDRDQLARVKSAQNFLSILNVSDCTDLRSIQRKCGKLLGFQSDPAASSQSDRYIYFYFQKARRVLQSTRTIPEKIKSIQCLSRQMEDDIARVRVVEYIEDETR